ncbi:MAG: TMEM175 family protein [Acidimicrobiales bacterium]
MSKNRLETFADGVFAIAATLLVVRVSADAPGGALGEALRHGWTQYAAYVLSFVMIGTWWVNHHAFMAVMDRVDRPFLLANIAFLICVGFLPFPTHLVAEHFHDDGLRAAVLTYGLTLTAAALCMSILWFHAARGRRLIAESADQAVVDRHSRDVRMGVPACATATLIAIWSPFATLAIIAAAALFYLFGSSFLERHHASTGSPPVGSS